MKPFLLAIALLYSFSTRLSAQTDTCMLSAAQHQIVSDFSEVDREFWVSLPMRYDSTESYPVLYVLDGEWRFNLVQQIAYDLGGNRVIPHHIVVGIPHIDWREQRQIDLTFSQSKNEYDSTLAVVGEYTPSNTGGAADFYRHLSEEVVPLVDAHYATSRERILVGHSYGGYFASYILPTDTVFTGYQIYDPSIWYSYGEVLEHFRENQEHLSSCRTFISFQPVPDYHASKIRELIELLQEETRIGLHLREYPKETHNSLYMYSVIDGLKAHYSAHRKR
ncbi:MAG: alpha/beta hydrolase-fold protein [Bacteroidota bacterium]